MSAKNGPSFPQLWLEIIRRDNSHCQYCHLDMSKSPEWRFLTVDHIIPKSQAHLCGKFGLTHIHDQRNLVTACRYCNNVQNRWPVPVATSTVEEVFRLKANAIREKRKNLDEWWKLKLDGSRP